MAGAFLLLIFLIPALSAAATAPPDSTRAVVVTPTPGEDRAPAGPSSVLQPEASTAIQADYQPWDSRKRPVAAVTELALLELIPFVVNRYIRDAHWAVVGSNAWWENLNEGWEYDIDNFGTNMFGHSYHGALFFNAARTNGYTFWESAPWSITGSIIWEYFGETYRPAFNDWIATGFTGITFGESLFRLSELTTDNQATGSERVWREIAGALVNPVRGFNRLISGETARVFPNPADRHTDKFHPYLTAGVRRLDADGDNLIDDAVTQALFQFDFRYGSITEGDDRGPFATFRTIVTLALPNRPEDSTGVLNQVSVEGLLHGWRLETGETRHTLTLSGIYDYLNNPAFLFGQTALSLDLYSSYRTGEETRLVTRFGIRGILMGGTPSDFYDDPIEGRNYDFGPGTGVRLGLDLVSEGWDVLTVFYNGGWLWTQSEPFKSRHSFHFVAAEGRYPLSERFAVGLSFALYWRNSYYSTSYYDRIDPAPPQPYDPQIARRNPVARLSIAWKLW